MADLKISQLPSATTPLAGTEVLPIVQSSATKQVSIANLTAGRSVSVADATLTTGNLVIGTSGKGIDFSATGEAGGMTSELLNDYEEGTWTPNITFLGATSSEGTYTKIGRQVTIRVSFTGTNMSFGATQIITDSLPFTVSGSGTGTIASGSNTNSGVIRVFSLWVVSSSVLTPGVTDLFFSATYFT